MQKVMSINKGFTADEGPCFPGTQASPPHATPKLSELWKATWDRNCGILMEKVVGVRKHHVDILGVAASR